MVEMRRREAVYYGRRQEFHQSTFISHRYALLELREKFMAMTDLPRCTNERVIQCDKQDTQYTTYSTSSPQAVLLRYSVTAGAILGRLDSP